MQQRGLMSAARVSLATAALMASALAGAGCADDPAPVVLERGGWDRNSGNYNGNPGSFADVTGLRGAPTWGATGAGTLNNATVYGIQYDPAVALTCATPTGGITAVNFLSSSGSAAAAVGPDVQVERVGGLRARLAMGEEIVFPGHVYDGYLGVADVAFRLRRVDTLVLRSALWYEWPVFALESCNASAQPGSWSHHGFVSWAPMVRLPELPGEQLELRSDIVQAITTVPRAEYQDNPNVPAVVAAQTGALWFKFAFYASLPIALHGDPDLDFTSDTGATIANGPFLWRGALALGNASWVSLPLTDDPAQHRFLSFFTKDGTAVAMFALARGSGASPSSLRLPSTWGGGVAAALELTDAERANPASLDSVQAQLAPVIGQQMAAEATHLGSGPSQYRAGLYAGNSSNNRRAFFYSRWRANAAAMRIDGIGSGRIASQVALEAAVRDPATPIDWLAACESPLRGGMAAFEQPGNWLPPPPDAPVVAMTGDAAVPDAGDGGLDTMRDAAPDALSPDALDTFDATMPGLPDAADAPMPPDAGLDADALDADAPMPPDAGLDADAPPDADAAPADAPGEGGPGADALVAPDGGLAPCFAICNDAA